MSEEIKHIIYSNMNVGENCDEDCHQAECNCNDIAFQDEYEILDKEVEGRILAIADIGRWNGRVSGYKILGNRINDIFFTECDYSRWYSDGKDIKAEMRHHDGTNYIEYRVIKEDRKIDAILNKIYNNEEISRQTLAYYTKSLHPYIAKIYGWR